MPPVATGGNVTLSAELKSDIERLGDRLAKVVKDAHGIEVKLAHKDIIKAAIDKTHETLDAQAVAAEGDAK